MFENGLIYMMRCLFLFVYDVVWFLALPWVIGYLWWRGRRLPDYRQRLNERLGFYRSHRPVDVWIHAVSVGEVVATRAMVKSFLDEHMKVLITTMTPTGSAQVERMWGNQVEHQYCPYDFSWAIERFLTHRKPKLLVVFETEIWPGILARCVQHHIPAVLANARISKRSYPRYQKTRILWKYILSLFSIIFVQSEEDKKRFLNIGALPEKIQVAGNLKFMQTTEHVSNQNWLDFKQAHPHRPIFVWGSTHHPEESLLLSYWHQFKRDYPQALLIVVPRHPERFDEVFSLLHQAYPGHVAKFSNWKQSKAHLDILLLDRMGELSSVYQIAYSAFVGGSLAPIGGHNLVEPLVFGVPVVTGPYIHNQLDMVRILEEHQAIIRIQTPEECMQVFQKLLEDKVYYQLMSRNGQQVVRENQNALSIHLQGIKALI